MSLWDTLLIPADKLQQLRTDAAADRPTHAWLFTGATGAPHREAAKFSLLRYCASSPTRRTAAAASARAA